MSSTDAAGRSWDRLARDRLAGAGNGSDETSRARKTHGPKERDWEKGRVQQDPDGEPEQRRQGQKTEQPPTAPFSSSTSMDTGGSKTERERKR